MAEIKYKIGERIGAGGMAEVFRAALEGTQGFERPVAVKRVLPARAGNPHDVALFVHEAHTMATLRHPNVIAVSALARDEEGGLMLVMELSEGVDLRALIRTGPVPASAAIYIMTELLRGLGYMHDRTDAAGRPLGLVHRDLTPGNVLLSWEGAVKLADFGLAKAYAGTKLADSDAYGTPGYMSPEQVGGGHQMDRRSDLFAAGVVLYELLTGTRPFVGADRMELDMAILRQPIAPPRTLRPEIPADLDAVTMQLLERDPARRPASADAVIEALEGCAAASHRGRGALMDLLRARFPASGAQGGRGVPGARRTKLGTARDEAPAAIWLVEGAADAVPAPAAEADPALVAQAAADAAPAPGAQASMASTAPRAQPPELPRPLSRPPAMLTRTGMRWAQAAALLLLVGSMTGWLLLRDGSAPMQQAQNQATEERRSEERTAPSSAPAPSPRETENAAQALPGGSHTLAASGSGAGLVPGDKPVEMF